MLFKLGKGIAKDGIIGPIYFKNNSCISKVQCLVTCSCTTILVVHDNSKNAVLERADT